MSWEADGDAAKSVAITAAAAPVVSAAAPDGGPPGTETTRARGGLRRWASPCLALTKPRVTGLIVITAVAAAYVGEARGAVWSAGLAETFLYLALGTALLSGGTAALNQLWEWRSDALMRRTKIRPLPAGRLQPRGALAFGVALMALGTAALALRVNALAAAMGLATAGLYLLVYTPLKYHSPLSTVIGALPGAGPILMGWAAARGRLDEGAWVLFGIQFLWQFPHFLAIAGLYREDYAKAGIRMLPVLDDGGEETGRQILLYSLALLPVSLLPAVIGLEGAWYFYGALLLGLWLLTASWRAAHSLARGGSLRLLKASVIYLPLLFGLMVLDKI